MKLYKPIPLHGDGNPMAFITSIANSLLYKPIPLHGDGNVTDNPTKVKAPYSLDKPIPLHGDGNTIITILCHGFRFFPNQFPYTGTETI